MSRAGLAGTVPILAIPPPTSAGPIENASIARKSDQSGADRRLHKRHSPDEIPFVSKARLKYGPAVALIDLSSGGAQIQTTNFRLQPGSTVVLELTGEQGDLSVPASVLRCQLANLLPEPVYRGALVFKRELDLSALGQVAGPAADADDEALSPEPEPELDADLDPATELAQLRQVLGRLALADGTPAQCAAARRPLLGALDASFAILDTPAGRRAGPELGEELAELFNAVATALERTPTASDLMAAIEEHLRHVVPASAIRFADPDTFVQLPGSEAIFLSVPRLSAGLPPARLAVEFPDGCEPQELHFQILKAGIQLVAIARELGYLNGADRPLLVRSAQPLPTGWSRVVVRHRNGHMHEGFTHDFEPTKAYLHLSPEPVVSPHNRVAIPFTDLKAILFVKDHDRDTAGAATALGAPGRPTTVSFADGEQLDGTTVDDDRGAPGFFLTPADPTSGHDRVYVFAHAVSAVTVV